MINNPTGKGKRSEAKILAELVEAARIRPRRQASEDVGAVLVGRGLLAEGWSAGTGQGNQGAGER